MGKKKITRIAVQQKNIESPKIVVSKVINGKLSGEKIFGDKIKKRLNNNYTSFERHQRESKLKTLGSVQNTWTVTRISNCSWFC